MENNRTLTWNKELPTLLGWYWTRKFGKYDPTVSPVQVGNNGVWLDSSWYHVELEPLFFEGREFFGPIAHPDQKITTNEPDGLRNRVLNRNDLTLEDYYYLDRLLRSEDA